MYFRKKFIGGFNRDDVTAYIAKLSQERNEAVAAADDAEIEIKRLRSEISRLQAQLTQTPSPANPLRAADADAAPAAAAPAEILPQTQEPEKKVIVIKRVKTKKRSGFNDI